MGDAFLLAAQMKFPLGVTLHPLFTTAPPEAMYNRPRIRSSWKRDCAEPETQNDQEFGEETKTFLLLDSAFHMFKSCTTYCQNVHYSLKGYWRNLELVSSHERLSIEELTMDRDVPSPAKSQHDSTLQMHCRGQEMFILNHQLCPSQQHVAAGTPAGSPRFSRLGMLMGPL